MSCRIPGAVLGLLTFAAVLRAADSPRSSPAPTREALEARVKEAQQLVFEDELQKAVAELKALGPTPWLQAKLGELYPAADAREKLTILHLLETVGVEHAINALPAIANDYAVASPKHPNDMSFAAHHVLEKYMQLAWKKLPAARNAHPKKETKDHPARREKPKPKPPAEHAPNKVAPDRFTHTGAPADRKSIRQFVLDHKLHVVGPKGKTYRVPPVADTDWVRVIGRHAFVRLRGPSSGVDYLFLKTKDGAWCYLATLGQWVN